MGKFGSKLLICLKGDFSGKIDYHRLCLSSKPHHPATSQTNLWRGSLDIRLHNFGSNWVQIAYPMDTFSSIHCRFDVEIPRGKFVEITAILKDESTWKLWHQFDVEISTWIRLSKSTKYRWVLNVDFSTLFRRRIDVTSVLAVSIVLFPNIFCSENLF